MLCEFENKQKSHIRECRYITRVVFFSQVLNKLLNNVLEGDIANGISTHAFLKFIRKVTKKDVRYWAHQWIFQSGHPKIECAYSFNRKKYMIELRVTQDVPYRYFVGPLLVRIQEHEGPFEHTLNLDSLDQTFEISYHSKGKRRKTKRSNAKGEDLKTLPLIDIEDTGGGDSFVSWVTIDPHSEWIADMTLQQADQMHARMLVEEKCVTAQLCAIQSLKTMSSTTCANALYRVLLDSRTFYKVRMQAASTLASLEDQDHEANGLKCLLEFFKQRYAMVEDTHLLILKPNHFGEISDYFVLKVNLGH